MHKEKFSIYLEHIVVITDSILVLVAKCDCRVVHPLLHKDSGLGGDWFVEKFVQAFGHLKTRRLKYFIVKVRINALLVTP